MAGLREAKNQTPSRGPIKNFQWRNPLCSSGPLPPPYSSILSARLHLPRRAGLARPCGRGGPAWRGPRRRRQGLLPHTPVLVGPLPLSPRSTPVPPRLAAATAAVPVAAWRGSRRRRPRPLGRNWVSERRVAAQLGATLFGSAPRAVRLGAVLRPERRGAHLGSSPAVGSAHVDAGGGAGFWRREDAMCIEGISFLLVTL